MCCISYWVLPLLSGAVWLGMLLGMLIGWTVDTHREHYSSMDADQNVAYISDIGATHRFKTLFIVCCCITTVLLDAAFLADRWLRHRGRLAPNESTAQKTLAVFAILFALIGTAGLILLSIFDVAHHKSLHDAFLLCFLAGYVLSAICLCAEYQRLGIHHRAIPILRLSFWLKLSFVIVEVLLAIVFASLTFTNHTTAGAIIEWAIAFIFAFYVFSFVIDLFPAVHDRHRLHVARLEADAADAADTTDDPVHSMEEARFHTPLPFTGHPGASNEPPSNPDADYDQTLARATRSSRTTRFNAPPASLDGPTTYQPY